MPTKKLMINFKEKDLGKKYLTSLYKKMFESKLQERNFSGPMTRQLLRTFKNKRRMTEQQYREAFDEYNTIVHNRRNQKRRQIYATQKLFEQLPDYIEQPIRIRQGQLPLNVFTHIVGQLDPVERYRQIMAKVLTKSRIYVQRSVNGKIVDQLTLKLYGNTPESRAWDFQTRYVNFKGSDTEFSVFTMYKEMTSEERISDSVNEIENQNVFPAGTVVKIAVFNGTKQTVPKEIRQQYRDGNTHCVIEPLKLELTRKMAESNSESTIKRTKKMINSLDRLSVTYDKGVPEDDMEIVANAVQKRLIISDIIGDEVKVYGKKYTSTFSFINVRENHLQSGNQLLLKNTRIEVDEDELQTLVADLQSKNEFFYFTKSANQYKSCITSTGHYTVKSEDNDIMNNFSKSIELDKYGYDSINNQAMHSLIQNSLIVNAWPTPLCEDPNNLDDVQHIDLEKAYTLHKQCKYYSGFLGVIHQYRNLEGVNPEFINDHIGIYQIKVLSVDTFIRNLGIEPNKIYELPSVEILYLQKEFNMKYELLNGVYGSRFDFEYTDEMLENKRYALWAGRLGMHREEDSYQFYTTRRFAGHLASTLQRGEVGFYGQKSGVGIITIPRKSNRVYHHIFSFITAYTRINMYESMRSIRGELVKVVMDGIYYRGCLSVQLPYKEKPTRKHEYFKDYWYANSTLKLRYPKLGNVSKNSVLIGQGGCGKTYSILTDKGFHNALYVSPTNALAFNTGKMYKCKHSTLHRLIGIDVDGKKTQSFREKYGNPSVILIDELTMCEPELITKAIQMYKESLILVAGDIDRDGRWYQCPNSKTNAIWKPPSDFEYIEFTEDRRSLDDELKDLKLFIRERMRHYFTDGGVQDAIQIGQDVYAKYPSIKFEQAVEQFKTGDIWIAGTHSVNRKLLEKGIVSGYITTNKEIIYEPKDNAQKRGAFTIHSFQGTTVEDSTVYISNDVFDYSMLYTAVSRVRNISQIVFVDTY